MEGFDCLGAEEKKDFDTLSFIEKVGPGVVSAVNEGLKKDEKPKDFPKAKEEKSWLTKPVLGPIPGAGVLALVGAVLVGGVMVVKKMVAR